MAVYHHIPINLPELIVVHFRVLRFWGAIAHGYSTSVHQEPPDLVGCVKCSD
ncbi:hypothetical protein QUA56_07900 [Microcoleus sp. N3A4]|uniref:hypothetical protein n=1 Tax=Microcoleus sp. N3A4 TaxID=3055379 RepID=UPI002FCEEB88